MARKKSGSSRPAKRVVGNAKITPDHEIDFSDIPEWTKEQLETAVQERRKRLAGRPPSGQPWKKLVSIRLDPKLLIEIRKIAAQGELPYQTWIHQTLKKAVKRKKSA